MVGVLYAAVGAAFVLGLLFVLAYSRRGSAEPRSDEPGSHRPRRADAVEIGPRADLASGGADDGTRAEILPRPYDVEAVAHRAQVHAETEGLRHAAEAEAEATLRAARSEAQSATLEAHTTRTHADAEAAQILAEARAAAQQEVARLTADARRVEAELSARDRRADEADAKQDAEERRLAGEAAEIDTALARLNSRQRDLDTLETDLQHRSGELAERAEGLDRRAGEFARELERIAGLSVEQAKAELMTGVEANARREAALLVRTIENEARSEGTAKAREIVVEAVQRVASEQTTETVVSVMHLPSDDMKGRIIGREGRNIRAYETVTGVNLIIDDTPEAVLLSCFDPVRREVGRLTLERLVLDGRIHPQRIEEAYERSKAEIEQLCTRAGEDALVELGLTDMHSELVALLGRRRYPT
ncbi:MAG: Rnase Y domain-containing protein, partial [Jatrophihabitantaceae bacterium]